MSEPPVPPRARQSLSQLFAEIIASDMSEETKTASFMAACIHQNYTDYASVMQPLYESAQQEIARLRHELATVRRMVREAYAGPYIPSEDLVTGCLYPTAEQLAQPEKP